IWFDMGAKIDELAENDTAVYTMILLGAVLLVLLAMVRIGEKRWRAAGLDLDGKLPDKEVAS
ncbi:MAG TPA: hypothetical protein VKZ63_13030, partial [Kofleriaceae bacterium]|nr:hypothetical protein [Kofleriaceae bacterium]